ncbi:L-threonylcarbamoyladenylate synthase [Novosphingobium tardum]|uniref:Threonylcarbamoyl-AMP synthase n=1 Tax=Novosphingobium tardum TaxID=1538021 RepID=A0ABV8RML9_9SPHN
MPATKTSSPAGMPRIAGPEALAEAAAMIVAGGLVAVPTETVYGLAARADSAEAVAAIYRAKGRPDFNPLIVHVLDIAQARTLAQFDDRAMALAQAFWPGPLTLVLPRRANAGLAPAVSAGLPTIALRCPAHPVLRDLLALVRLPLAAPSANRSGAISPTTAHHVAASLGAALPLVIDGGPTERGIESTIVALREGAGWQVLREGPLEKDRIAEILGAENEVIVSNPGIEAPGQLASHYAPSKPVRLDAVNAQEGEYLIGFGPVAGNASLSPRGDLAEAAAALYACLHAADAAPEPRIAVARVPEHGIGVAINDRLRRAAAG